MIPVGLGLFGAIFLWYIIDLIANIGMVNLFYVFAALILFVFTPYLTKKTNKYETVIVTPEFLIQRKSRTEFSAVRFDDITSFKLLGHGIVIDDKHDQVVLGLSLERDDLDPIIGILEAKGKTFDRNKDFMIRPVEIEIADNKITLIDIEQVSELDNLYQQITDDYMMLTPGFIDTIVFRNASISGCCTKTDKENIAIEFDQFEVKEGHPENTKFDSIMALDCIVVFHKAEIKKAVLRNRHDQSEKPKNLPKEMMTLKEYLPSAIVTTKRLRKNGISFVIATGLNTLELSIDYKDVIIGWNKTKE